MRPRTCQTIREGSPGPATRLSPVVAQGCTIGRYSKVVSSLGYTGRAANVVATAALDPEEIFHLADARVSCNVKVISYRDEMKSGCYALGRFVVPGRTVERGRP